jgi:hypothetical protein
VIYRLDQSGNETVIHTFTGLEDGSLPTSQLVEGEDGNLYGTTVGGGDLTTSPCKTYGEGCGVVYKLTRHDKCDDHHEKCDEHHHHNDWPNIFLRSNDSEN